MGTKYFAGFGRRQFIQKSEWVLIYMKVGQEPLYRDKRGKFDDNYCLGFAVFLTHDARTSNTDVAKM